MIGERYWATGITVRYGYAGQGRSGWHAEVSYFDDGFAEDGSTEGVIRTRYIRAGDAEALAAQIALVKADAERLGITFQRHDDLPPAIYYNHDGEDREYPPPDGWRELLAVQATRLGWNSYSNLARVERERAARQATKAGQP